MEDVMDLTRQQAAERLAVSDQTVDKLIRLGKLECYRECRRVRIPAASLERHLAQCRAEAGKDKGGA